jgi:hypothetical protein
MEILATAVYLLIGFQFGARTFFWGRNIDKSPYDFIVPLVCIPLM